jgi:DNA-binding CsgD family transcriptional regulator
MIPASILDHIYEAALLPERWPSVLDLLSRQYGARGGLLVGGTAPDMQWIAGGEDAESTMTDFVNEGWMAQNDRIERIISRRYMGFQADFHTPEEIARLPMYTEFLTPRGYDSPVATYAPGILGDDFVLSLEGFEDRAGARAALPSLDAIRPHLARAAAMSARIGLERARAMVTALESLSFAVGIVNAHGRIVAVNRLFERELGVRMFESGGRLRLATVGETIKLTEALDLIGTAEAGGRSIALQSADQLPPSVMHVLPLRRGARDLFTGALAMLVLSWGRSTLAPDAGVLGTLFDLTPAEAQIAGQLAVGTPIKKIAMINGISVNTARVHIRNIHGKINTNRQVDLVLLLRDLSI